MSKNTIKCMEMNMVLREMIMMMTMGLNKILRFQSKVKEAPQLSKRKAEMITGRITKLTMGMRMIMKMIRLK